MNPVQSRGRHPTSPDWGRYDRFVKHALEIIGRHDKEVANRVRLEIGFVERNRKRTNRYGVQTTAHKKAARQLSDALRRLQVALNSPHLPDILKTVGARLIDDDNMRQTLIDLDAKNDIFFDVWLKRASKEADTKLEKLRSNPAAQFAVQAAVRLVKIYLPQLGRGRRRTINQLAAVLDGERHKPDFYKHYRISV
jgi:hypothetical protein